MEYDLVRQCDIVAAIPLDVVELEAAIKIKMEMNSEC